MWRRADVGINPRWLANGWTLGLDCNSKWYGVLENDVLTLKHVHLHRGVGRDADGSPRAVPREDAPWCATPTSSSEDIIIHLKEPSHPSPQ